MRGYTFTDYALLDLAAYRSALPKAKYIIYGVETCPSTGRKHHQGYIQHPNTRFSTLGKKLGGAHVESAKGTDEQNYRYCRKLDTETPNEHWYEWGEREIVRPGARGDLQGIREHIAKGGRIRDLDLVNLTQIQYAEKVARYSEPCRDWKPVVEWYWGPPGVGKTRKAFEENPEMFKKRPGKWWDGYDGHEVVLFDDFRPADMEFNELLQVLDRYAHSVETKGGMRQLLCKKIVITSPLEPHRFVPFGEDDLQLMRRIDVVEHIE